MSAEIGLVDSRIGTPFTMNTSSGMFIIFIMIIELNLRVAFEIAKFATEFAFFHNVGVSDVLVKTFFVRRSVAAFFTFSFLVVLLTPMTSQGILVQTFIRTLFAIEPSGRSMLVFDMFL